jgi:hypothetical protein
VPRSRPVSAFIGWVIRVQPVGASPAKLYAVLTDNIHHAEALVGDYCGVTNQRLTLAKVMDDNEVARLGLKRDEVKPYG